MRRSSLASRTCWRSSAHAPTPPVEVAACYTSYGDLKADTANAVVALLEPVQSRYAELKADPDTVDKLLEIGRDRAIAFAKPQLDAAMRAIGLPS
jgi:tryptophanyl-tRNA synthetase